MISMRLIFLCFVVLFFSCQEKKQTMALYPSESSQERVDWDIQRLADPITGKIPKNIRQKELLFSKNLPKSNSFSKNNWQHRGPYNVGGRTRALCLDVLDENTILAGGASGGMFRSTDGGQSWNMTTEPSQEHRISCLSQDRRPGKENIWYFGTGENRGSYVINESLYGNGIWKSIDGGLSWDSLPMTTTNTPTSLDGDFDFMFSLKTDPSNDSLDVVYAATRGDIYRTEDGGTNWSKQLGGANSNYYQYTDIEVTSSGIVYATISSNCTDKGIWRSADGQNWSNIVPPTFAPGYSRVEIGVSPSNENVVYFVAAETTGYGQFSQTFFNGSTWSSLWKYEYLSGDGTGVGGRWTDLSANIPANNIASFDNFNAQGSYDLLVSVHPTDTNLIILGGTNLWRSTDGFTSPNNTSIIGGYMAGSVEGHENWGSYENHHPDQHEIIYLPSNDDILLNGNDGGVYKTLNIFKDTVDWISLNNGYNTTQLYTATISKNANSNVMHAGLQDNGNRVTFSSNSNSTWKMPFNGDGMIGGIADNEEDFYLSIQRGVLYKMKLDNTGAAIAFQRMDPASSDSTNYRWKNPMTIDENNDNVLYWSERNKIWRHNSLNSIAYNNSNNKSDFGWDLLNNLPVGSNLGGKAITTLNSSTSPSDILYFGVSPADLFRIDNASSGNSIINNLGTPKTQGNSYCADIAINPDDADEIIAVFSNYGVYSLNHSVDGGQSWKIIGGNLEETYSGAGNGPSCRTAAIVPFDNDTLYLVGTTVGLFGTTNIAPARFGQQFAYEDSTVWQQIGFEEFGSTIVEDIQFRRSDNLLVVATYGNGVYQINLNSSNILLSSNDILSEQLELNIYPNPTSQSINISISKNNLNEYRWVIYNELGSIVNQSRTIKTSGIVNEKIDVSNLKSGVYFISFIFGEKVLTKEFIKN